VFYSFYPPQHGYARSETYEVDLREQDCWSELDGSKRSVYRYGPRNIVGGKYVWMGASGRNAATDDTDLLRSSIVASAPVEFPEASR